MRRAFLFLLAAALLAGTFASARHHSRSRSHGAKKQAALAKLHAINVQMHAVRQQKREAEVRERTFAKQLEDTQQQLSDTKDHIETAETHLQSTQHDLGEAKSQLEEARDRLAKRNALLTQRLVATQRRGTVSYAAVLFHSSDYWDYLSRRRLMSRLVSYDIQLVNAIRADEAATLRWQQRLMQKTAEQKQIVSYLDDQRVVREGLRQQQANEVNAAAKDADRYAQMLEELEQNSSQIQSFIQRLAVTPAGRARAAIPFHGRFMFPVNARVTSPFGMRFHPILHRFKLHTGIDFGVGMGTPLRAAANGLVVHAGWWGAYGNAVIIDHGGGLTTLYGHLSVVLCHTGEVIQQGRMIGKSGSTGWSTGPHCHFEIRKNGVPVNPLSIM